MSITTNKPATTTQNQTQSIVGNAQAIYIVQQILTAAPVQGPNVVEQFFTVPGLLLGDTVQVSKPITQPGLGIVDARVVAANTLALSFVNPTSGIVIPTPNESYTITVARPTSQSLVNGLPVSNLIA